jgi:hypothetical protein
MERPLTDEQAAGLTAAERKDIAYHRPPRVGDMLFNWFEQPSSASPVRHRGHDGAPGQPWASPREVRRDGIAEWFARMGGRLVTPAD